jgi:hypothetical protein
MIVLVTFLEFLVLDVLQKCGYALGRIAWRDEFAKYISNKVADALYFVVKCLTIGHAAHRFLFQLT